MSAAAPPTDKQHHIPQEVPQSHPQATSSPSNELQTSSPINGIPNSVPAKKTVMWSKADGTVQGPEKLNNFIFEASTTGNTMPIGASQTKSLPTNLSVGAMHGPETFSATMCSSASAQHSMPTSHAAQRASPNDSDLRKYELRLAMLKEEQELQQSYLEKKYEILSRTQGISSLSLHESRIRSTPTATQIAERQAIPKDLPHFHGDPEEWPIFISSFETSTQVAGYSNAENLIRLQASLKGRARETVRSKLLLPTMVPEIIETLRMCFGRPEFIIENLIEKARKIQPLKDKLESLIDFAFCVRNIHSTMASCHMNTHMDNPMLVKELVDKLPNTYKLSWAMHPRNDQTPIVQAFSDWLYSLAEAASKVVRPTTFKRNGGVVNTHTHIPADNSQRKKGCGHCGANGHRVAQCDDFKKLSLERRWEVVRSLKLCRQCLNAHRRRCFVNKVCAIDGCNAKHHQLLHRSLSKPDEHSSEHASNGSVNSHSAQQKNSPYFRVIPVRIHGDNNYLDTFAFLDEGSSVSLMEEDIFTKLNMKGVSDPLCLRWTGNNTRNEDLSKRVTLRISNKHNGKTFAVNDVHTIRNLGLPTQTVDMIQVTKEYPHLSGLPIQSYVNAKPAILIGSNNWHLAVPIKIREGNWRQPIATKTRLGWAIQGRSSNVSQSSHLNIHTCACRKEYETLHDLVKESFKLDSSPSSQLLSPQDSKALAILDATCQKTGDKYEVGLLWRHDNVDLPDSYEMAYKRLVCLHKRFQKEPALRAAMQEQINNLLTKGYATKLSASQVQMNIDPVWYLPIFVTRNPNKPEKLRLVWDAAAKSRGVSLNDKILSGPDLLKPLVEILLGFRIGQVAICGDIAEMFHQINVRRADMHVQRFLWWDKDDEFDKPSVYVMRALTFGISCAPCIAHYVRNKNADNFLHQHPRAADAIKHHHYVDDFIDSEDSEQAALDLAESVKVIHASGVFHIRNWASNSALVLARLGGRDKGDQPPVQLGASEKILGVYWDPDTDVFKYALKFARLKRDVITSNLLPTKREVLQVLMSVFDPLGFVSHYTIALKILLQDIWRSRIDWDEGLPDVLYDRWCQWKVTVPQMLSVEIPRCYAVNLNKATDVQLHTFVDAGEYGYAAVSYLRVQVGSNVDISLVAAKSKVAPLSPVSIPRLELQAAIIGIRLSSRIQGIPRVSINRKIFWTDSSTVLKWLAMDPRQFRQFVMYRVAEILENTDLQQWRWIPSRLNPADLATKQVSKVDTATWISGPNFLKADENDWPNRKNFGPIDDSVEIKHHVLHIREAKQQLVNVNTEYFSSWRRLYRAIATFILYIKKLQAKVHSLTKPSKVNFEMVEMAKGFLMKQAQLSEFMQEIISLKCDDQDVMRVRSRAEFICSRDAIVLPRNNQITSLIVKDAHEIYHHLSHEAVINNVKARFYIPRLRILYRTIQRSCQVCKNKAAVPLNPQMASLPRARLACYERPFSYIGIDYFGPIFVVVGRRREKRWGVIFTCLTIRAVHIEVAHSLDTSSCIMCINNFISRRGIPREIYTDNGTNFKAAEKILRDVTKNIDYSAIEAKLDTIRWKFNPPAAPHMGGAWERLVRSIKTVLYAMNPTHTFNDETLRSALLEVEYMINSRPLTFVSTEALDDEAITPNHMLLGSADGYKPAGTSGDLHQRYRQSQIFADMFWQRWVKEYKPMLTKRTKWFKKQPPLKTGDVVVIVDETQPRNRWPKGIVVEVVTARDGQVRRATVKTQFGMLERPATKLAILDVGNKNK